MDFVLAKKCSYKYYNSHGNYDGDHKSECIDVTEYYIDDPYKLELFVIHDDKKKKFVSSSEMSSPVDYYYDVSEKKIQKVWYITALSKEWIKNYIKYEKIQQHLDKQKEELWNKLDEDLEEIFI